MRKLLCLVLVLLCVFSAAGCSKVSVSENASAKVVYDYNGISFSEVLTEQETAAVAQILNGKRTVSYWGSTPSCGFDSDIAIVIGGTRYALACDKCTTLKVCGTLATYIEISQSERDVLEKIFTSRGGKFPCV